MIDHDRLFKELISTFFVEFLDLFLPQLASAIDKRYIRLLPETVLNDVTSGEQKKIDLLAKVKYKNRSDSFLIHVEAQSYSKSKRIFPKRMFKYFGRLYEKYDLPIYPVVVFSFDKPQRAEPKTHNITFPDLDVLQFQFAAIQLNRLNWRDYLTQRNPVAAALMSKMNIAVAERPLVKLECLRLLATLKLDPVRVKMISGFVDTYLQLNAKEEKVFQAELSKIGLDEQEEVMEIVTSWERKAETKARKETLEQVAINALQKGLAVDLIIELTGLTRKQVLALQAKLSKTINKD